MKRILIGVSSAILGVLLGYMLPAIFKKSDEGSSGVAEVPFKADKKDIRRSSNSASRYSAVDKYSDSPSRLALASRFSWLPPRTLEEVVDSWQVLFDELDDDGVGEYCHKSVALLILEKIAREDPDEILDMLITTGNLHMRAEQLEVIAAVWEEILPGQFELKISDIPDGASKLALNRALTLALMKSDPSLALEKLESGDLAKSGDFYQLFNTWAIVDKEAALRAVSTITNPRHQQEALGGIVKKLGEEDLRLTWQWVGDLTIGNRESLIRTLCTTASADDDAFLFDAVKELSDPGLRSRVVLGNVSNLSRLNLDKTYELVMDEFTGESLYVAVSNMIPQSVQKNPQLALAAIEQMPLGNRRDRLVGQLYGEWSSHDSEAATAWSVDMGLSDLIENTQVSADQPIVWDF